MSLKNDYEVLQKRYDLMFKAFFGTTLLLIGIIFSLIAVYNWSYSVISEKCIGSDIITPTNENWDIKISNKNIEGAQALCKCKIISEEEGRLWNYQNY